MAKYKLIHKTTYVDIYYVEAESFKEAIQKVEDEELHADEEDCIEDCWEDGRSAYKKRNHK